MKPVQKILVATDFSNYANAALDFAVDLSRKYEAPLMVAHVTQPLVSMIPTMGSFVPGEYDDQLLKDANKMVEEAAQRLRTQGAVSVTSRVTMGTPFLELVYLAHEGAFDLVVVGTHGRTGLKHVLMGSVAEQVVRHCSCSVLTVRHADMRAKPIGKP